MSADSPSIKKPMKICIMATVPISIVSFYGRQLDYLKENGFEVTVVTSDDRDLVKKISSSCRLWLVPMSRKITPLRDIYSLWALFNRFKKEKFDIIQYSSPKAALLGSICGYLLDIPVRIYLMWGIYYTGQTGWRRKFLKLCEKTICFFSTQVLPDSRGNLDFALEQGLCPGEKLSVVGNGSANGVDLERFDPSSVGSRRNKIRGILGIPRDAFVAGFVGRLTKEKGINELVEAFYALKQRYPGIYLLLVGPKENKGSEFDPRVSRILAEEKGIVLAGFQDRPEDFMAAMDVFVLPSYREGFGIVNIEASAMELPVVSTDIPGPRDSVLDRKTGMLIPVRSASSVEKAIEILLNNPIMRRDMGVAGRQWAENFEQKRLWREIIFHRFSSWRRELLMRKIRFKRIFDLAAGTTLLFLLLPLMFLVFLSVFLAIGRPVIFRQRRPGYLGRIFTIYKFRTMFDSADSLIEVFSDAKRLTKLGMVLRKLSLDELPELFNVLKGEMSLIGPRPLLEQYLKRYSPEQARRHELKPGITGWAQVNGRNAISWEDKFKLDIWYIDNYSFWLDLKIVIFTIARIFFREGINRPGLATTEEFRGKEQNENKI